MAGHGCDKVLLQQDVWNSGDGFLGDMLCFHGYCV